MVSNILCETVATGRFYGNTTKINLEILSGGIFFLNIPNSSPLKGNTTKQLHAPIRIDSVNEHGITHAQVMFQKH